MATRIGKRFTFEAAHHLPDHDGKCARPHGHSYVVEVAFVGSLAGPGAKHGMVIDYGDVSALWREELEPLLDHRDLNETINVPVTTAENIARWLYERFVETLGAGLVERVRVWETSSSWAEWPA